MSTGVDRKAIFSQTKNKFNLKKQNKINDHSGFIYLLVIVV